MCLCVHYGIFNLTTEQITKQKVKKSNKSLYVH